MRSSCDADRPQLRHPAAIRGGAAVLAGIEAAIPRASAQAQVRYFLELGRTYASTTHKAEEITPEWREKARSAYTHAFEKAKAARLDYLAIDALHMMVIVDSGADEQLAWNEKALAYMEASSQDEAKKWEGSLRNNVGYAHHLAGRYDEALAQFRLSLAAHERNGRAANARIAHWMIARTLRVQGKAEEATRIQLRLEREWKAPARRTRTSTRSSRNSTATPATPPWPRPTPPSCGRPGRHRDDLAFARAC